MSVLGSQVIRPALMESCELNGYVMTKIIIFIGIGSQKDIHTWGTWFSKLEFGMKGDTILKTSWFGKFQPLEPLLPPF